MEDKIEVGEYVRTDNGEIHRVIDIEKGSIKIKSQYKEWIGLCCIAKHSKQLIDLVEVGDYVNGREVKHIAMFEGFPDYPKLIFVDETHLIPDDTCENEDIKTILTKEQYMANCYKVGGEEEKMNREYYKRINNLEIDLEKTNHKYLMINQWARDNSHKWGIASFKYDEIEDYWYLRTYGNFNFNVDWYDFGCLVQLGYKWIKDGCLYDNPELLGGE